jgi:7-cyano-7-deazaguanine synthase in queuosine biosynthesis
MKIGVLMSGGLDSSILAAITKKEHQVIGYSYEQTTNNKIFAKKICDILNIEYQSLENFPLIKKRSAIYAANKVLDLNKVDLVYIGITKNPPIPILYNTDIPTRIIEGETINNRIKAPFSEMYKNEVLDIGLKNVPEINEIIKYSHTCCATKGKRCNKCFNCQERTWAFDKLKVIDHGKY